MANDNLQWKMILPADSNEEMKQLKFQLMTYFEKKTFSKKRHAIFIKTMTVQIVVIKDMRMKSYVGRVR